MKTLHAIWTAAKYNEVLQEEIPAHMELWQVAAGDKHGQYLCDLPEWVQQDEGAFFPNGTQHKIR